MPGQKSLLSRLASYSLQPDRLSVENFTTEILGHLFNEDPVFRKHLLRILIPDGRKRQPWESDAEASTQEKFDIPEDRSHRRLIADLVLRVRDRGREHLHFVEVKVAASESREIEDGEVVRSQIGDYLRLGNGEVTYLTPWSTPDPIEGNDLSSTVPHLT